MWKDYFFSFFEITLTKNCLQLLFLIYVQRAFAWSCLFNPVSKKRKRKKDQLQSLLTISPRIHIKFPCVVIQSLSQIHPNLPLQFMPKQEKCKNLLLYPRWLVYWTRSTSTFLTIYLWWCHSFHLEWPVFLYAIQNLPLHSPLRFLSPLKANFDIQITHTHTHSYY